MSDAPPNTANISDDYVASQRAIADRLDNAVAANPADTMSRESAALIRRTLADAIAATGWTDPKAADTRTEAERLHDRRHGIEPVAPTAYETPQSPAEGFDTG